MLFINLTRIAPVNSSGKYNSIKSKREYIDKEEPSSPKSNKSRGDQSRGDRDSYHTREKERDKKRSRSRSPSSKNSKSSENVTDNRPPLGNAYMSIIYFPYNPEYILNQNKASTQFCNEQAEYLNLSDKYLFQHKDNIIRQKLVDLFYAAEDGESFHLVLDCHSKFKECADIASQFCRNYMCKLCCLSDPNRQPCVLHDSWCNIIRAYIHDVIEFERKNNFDRTRTVKLVLGGRIKFAEIKKVFEDLEVLWDQSKYFFSDQFQRIHNVYLTFTSKDEAKKAYEYREELIGQFKEGDISYIKNLYEPMDELTKRFKTSLNRTLVLYVPIVSCFKAHQSVPKKSERVNKIA